MRFYVTLSALLCVAPAAQSGAQDATRVIRVVDDGGAGVESELFKLTSAAPPQKTRIGKTRADGTLSVTMPCAAGEQLRAEPVSSAFYNPQNMDCPMTTSPTQLLVTRVEYASNLLTNAEAAEASGNFALSALLYNDLYARTISNDKAAASNFKAKTFDLMGRHLNVAGPGAVSIGPKAKVVMTPGLQRAITHFQDQNGLEQNGVLDFSTLTTAAGVTTITPYILKKGS